jgi:enamine deaminase RidA (YjgF/YER057c/UK114 family)
MKHILEAGGSSLKEVVKVTVLLRQMSDYATVNKIYATCSLQPFLSSLCRLSEPPLIPYSC